MPVLLSQRTTRYPDRYRILISAKDFERVSKQRWAPFQTASDKRRRRIYFVSRIPQPNGQYRRVYLHRFIMNALRCRCRFQKFSGHA